MKILVCTDGSEQSEAAVRCAAIIARAAHSDITVLRVREKPRSLSVAPMISAREKLQEWGLELPSVRSLMRAREILREAGIEIGKQTPEHTAEKDVLRETAKGVFEIHVMGSHGTTDLKLREGKPEEEILKEAEEGRYDLIVIGSRKLKGLKRIVLGGVSHKVAEYARTSVLVVKKQGEIKRMLICDDGQECTKGAVLFGGRIARDLDCAVTVLSVAASEGEVGEAEKIAKAAADALRQIGVEAKAQALIGDPPSVIIEQGRGSEIIVLGARGSAAQRFMLGSIASEVLEYGDTSTLVVRQR